MATLPGTLRRIQNAQRAEAQPQTGRYTEYEPMYREILAAVNDAGGDDALSELSDWMTDRIHEAGRLPEPSAVRCRARDIVTERGVSMPIDSPLRERVDAGNASSTANSRTPPAEAHGWDVTDSTFSGEPSSEELLAALEPFEPYTADELADELDQSPGLVRSLLNKLLGSGEVRKKEPRSSPAIWIREPPVNSCSDCGYRFGVKFVHPVLSPVQFCPRCGTHI